MEILKFKDIMTFSSGVNTTRLQKNDENLFSTEDFDNTFNSREKTHSSLCIINLIKSKAVPCLEKDVRKTISQNFLKCLLDTDVILPWYFCCQFNEGKALIQQIKSLNQGTFLAVKRLNVNIISNLEIRIPDLKKQKLIGELYRLSLLQYEQQLKVANDIKTYSFEMINRLLEK